MSDNNISIKERAIGAIDFIGGMKAFYIIAGVIVVIFLLSGIIARPKKPVELPIETTPQTEVSETIESAE